MYSVRMKFYYSVLLNIWQNYFQSMYTFFCLKCWSIEGSKLTKKIFSGKIQFLQNQHFWSKRGQNDPNMMFDFFQDGRFLTYLEFSSSDFDETLWKCSWYEKNEDWMVWSHVCQFFPWQDQIRSYLVPKYAVFNISRIGSSDFDETLRKRYWYENSDGWLVWSHVCPFWPRHAHHLGPN